MRRISLSTVLILLLMVVAILARVIPGPRTIDDAFITFRYSRNIIEGAGFVYNPGEAVLGTTTPLFTLLMALIGGLLRGSQDYQSFPYYALTVSALADACNVVLLFVLARRLTGSVWAGALAGFLWAIAAYSVTFAIGGMETSVVILFMLSAVYCYMTDRTLLLGLFLALALLTRPDTAILIGLLGLGQIVQLLGKRLTLRAFLRTWLLCGALLLPYLIYATVTFGSPIPRSLTAKRVAYRVKEFSALVVFIQDYGTPFAEYDAFGSIGVMVGSVVYLVLALIGILAARRRCPKLLPLLIFPFVYALAFILVNPLVFRWYQTPPMPAYILAIIGGVWAVAQVAGRGRVVIYAAVSALWVISAFAGWVLTPDHEPFRPAPKMAWHQIELVYQQVGTALREKHQVTPETHIAAADIGAVGYFSRAYIIDTVGLITPASTAYYPIPAEMISEGSAYAVPPQIIRDTKPVFVVVPQSLMQNSLAKDAAFLADYGDPIMRLPLQFYGPEMFVYQRVAK